MKMACIHLYVYHCTDNSTTGGEKTEEINFEGCAHVPCDAP